MSTWETADPHLLLGVLSNRCTDRKLRLLALAIWYRDHSQICSEKDYRVWLTLAHAGKCPQVVNPVFVLAHPLPFVAVRSVVEQALDKHHASTQSLMNILLDIGGDSLIEMDFSFYTEYGNVLSVGCIRCDELVRALPDFGIKDMASPWRPPHVVSLARQIDETADYTGMLVLSDALEECGCDSKAMLDHLRSPGPHYPGCWVIDFLLGRS